MMQRRRIVHGHLNAGAQHCFHHLVAPADLHRVVGEGRGRGRQQRREQKPSISRHLFEKGIVSLCRQLAPADRLLCGAETGQQGGARDRPEPAIQA